jgi:hypothetical protein
MILQKQAQKQAHDHHDQDEAGAGSAASPDTVPGPRVAGGWLLRSGHVGKTSLTAQDVQELCRGFRSIPTDGNGLEPELRKLGETFAELPTMASVAARSARPSCACPRVAGCSQLRGR